MGTFGVMVVIVEVKSAGIPDDHLSSSMCGEGYEEKVGGKVWYSIFVLRGCSIFRF
jgi:hypothetical protein